MADEGVDDQPLMRPTENSSGWAINWSGFAAVLLIGVICLIGWRWLDGSSGESSVADRAHSPATSVRSAADQAGVVPTPNPAVTTTRPPVTTTVASTTTTLTPDRRVLISGVMEPCRFGANCLVASFEIVGFDQHPGTFVCVYPNSQREFNFNDSDVVGACLSGDVGDTITIEVDGVRSATISEQNLDGT